MANKVGQIMSVMRTFANGATAQYQKIGGKAVTQLRDGATKTTRVRQGSKVATRTVNSDGYKDILKIKNSETANVSDKRVNSRTVETYSYDGDGLDIRKSQVDKIYKNNEFIGNREVRFCNDADGNKSMVKYFFDKCGSWLKTVEYNPETGMRIKAHSAEGQVLFDNKGLPIFSDRYFAADLGGLDKLV